MIDHINRNARAKGWLSLSPLLVFLAVYLISSLLANDFYAIPVSAAFLFASAYALLSWRGESTENKIAIFSRGAGNPNILTMIWIFILAGAFAATAKAMGAIDATVNLTLKILPSNMLYAGIFLASCFISISIGTSVGTIAALIPVTTGIASEAGISVGFLSAIVVGGAFFGDNLSFISDTTIAATKSQGCKMSDKFKKNIALTLPAAGIVLVLYLILGHSVDPIVVNNNPQWVKLLPYILIIVLAIIGTNVISSLAIALVLSALLGFIYGDLNWASWLGAIGQGIANMSDLIIVTLLAGGLLEIIRERGGIDFIINGLTRRIRGRKGAELSIAALVSLTNMCTANNTIAIITTGSIAREIAERFGVDPRKSASILDTFSCVIQGIIPYGAQLLIAAGLSGVATTQIIPHLFYPLALCVFSLLSILLTSKNRNYGR